MPDSVLITTADQSPGVLEPTLTDAVLAAQQFALSSESDRAEVAANKLDVLAAKNTAVSSANTAVNAAAQATNILTQLEAATFVWYQISLPTTLILGRRYLVDTRSTSFTVTLPNSPIVNSAIVIRDSFLTFDTNELTVNRNGNLIESVADNYVFDIEGVGVELIFVGGSIGWKLLPY